MDSKHHKEEENAELRRGGVLAEPACASPWKWESGRGDPPHCSFSTSCTLTIKKKEEEM